LEGARKRAESYLNDSGRGLARGKTDGATVYSVSASLETAGKSVNGDERVLFTNRTPGSPSITPTNYHTNVDNLST